MERINLMHMESPALAAVCVCVYVCVCVCVYTYYSSLSAQDKMPLDFYLSLRGGVTSTMRDKWTRRASARVSRGCVTSAPHNSRTPHACAGGTSARRFWSNSCTGISWRPSASAGEPSDWTCLRRPCCSESRKKASPLGGWGGVGRKRDGQCFQRKCKSRRGLWAIFTLCQKHEKEQNLIQIPLNRYLFQRLAL